MWNVSGTYHIGSANPGLKRAKDRRCFGIEKQLEFWPKPSMLFSSHQNNGFDWTKEMANTGKRARFYRGANSVSTPGSYGVKATSGGVHSESGKLKHVRNGDDRPEVIEARKKVEQLRRKKADRGRKRMQRQIDAARGKYERGEYTKKQLEMRIKQIKQEYLKKARKRKEKTDGTAEA